MDTDEELVLVVDDDPDIVRFVELNLQIEGYRVAAFADGEEALQAALELKPDLMLLDVMMPRVDGLEVCRRLRADVRTRQIAIIMVTARSLSADRVVGLTAGADDYIIKPFDPVELVARVKSTLRRSRELRDVNPLTQLPGNVQLQDEIAKRSERNERFAVMYIDLDSFKAYNDYYGFLKGDEAIKKLSDCLCGYLLAPDEYDGFVGHVGGDDFIAVVGGIERARAAAERVIDCWDDSVRALYEPADAERGFIEVPDRQKNLHRYPLTTVSIGIAAGGGGRTHWEVAQAASEMKGFAKKERRSSYAIDRRGGQDRSPATTSSTERGPNQA